MGQRRSTPRDVQLLVSDEGHYLLDGVRVDLSELGSRLRALKGEDVEVRVIGSGVVKYEHVAPALQIVQEEGMVRAWFGCES
jgi:biopolymer transport protein ExbD